MNQFNGDIVFAVGKRAIRAVLAGLQVRWVIEAKFGLVLFWTI